MHAVRRPESINMEDFESKILKTDTCWIWQGSKYANGYGKIGKAGYMVHRIAYENAKGQIPYGMKLDHLCKVRLCVNPDHLEVVTLIENVMRGSSFSANNARKTHCKHGHEFTVENTYIPPKRPNRRYCKACRT
jgi:hypothetical protein